MIPLIPAIVGIIGFFTLSARKSRVISSRPAPAGKISCIIPCHNEERNIANLLEDLQAQDYDNYEVIVVDDRSNDATADIVTSYDAELLTLTETDTSWRPKPFALHSGATIASGEYLVFLDADVRCKKTFLAHLARELASNECVSVQPFHESVSYAEQMSLFFHVVSIVASGLFSLFRVGDGVYGPCIALRKETYTATKGFASENVRNSLTEDLALAQEMKQQGVTPARLMIRGFHYRMYFSFREVLSGWHKNIAQGASSTSAFNLIVLILYIGALISLPIALITTDGITRLCAGLLLFIAVALLWNVARKLGHYSSAVFTYPVALGVFIAVFLWSGYSLVFRRNVRWKDQVLSK